jgi:hypothetical protein
MCRFKLGAFVIMRHLTRRCLVTFARPLRSSFGFRPSQAYAPRSSRFHQRYPLTNPFLFTGPPHNLTMTVANCFYVSSEPDFPCIPKGHRWRALTENLIEFSRTEAALRAGR